jgi:hypothetical protein
LKAFQRYVARHLHAQKLGRFLTFSGPSFGHNLCFRCPNEQYEPILDIYVPRAFHWYKKTPQAIEFWPLQSPSEDLGLHWDSNSQNGTPLGCESSFPHTFSHSQEYVVQLSASLLARNLANPCFGREPKARVATICANIKWCSSTSSSFDFSMHSRSIDVTPSLVYFLAC